MRSAVILYGGKSVRMGVDKGMLQLNGKPLFLWVYESVSRVVDEVVISVSHKKNQKRIDFKELDAIIVTDEKHGMGPLGGLMSGMNKTSGEYVAVAPVDAPLIKPQLYELLFKKIKGHGAAVPKVRGYWEPLVAVYERSSMISAIDKVVASSTLDIRSTFPYLDMVEVKQCEIEVIDPDFLSFTNINTMDDLEGLKRITEFK